MKRISFFLAKHTQKKMKVASATGEGGGRNAKVKGASLFFPINILVVIGRADSPDNADDENGEPIFNALFSVH